MVSVPLRALPVLMVEMNVTEPLPTLFVESWFTSHGTLEIALQGHVSEVVMLKFITTMELLMDCGVFGDTVTVHGPEIGKLIWLVPPPGAGFVATMVALPGLATSEAGTVAVIWLQNVVP